mgnify:CR=1 FL=1
MPTSRTSSARSRREPAPICSKDATDEDLLPARPRRRVGQTVLQPGRHRRCSSRTTCGTLQTRGLTDSYHLLTDREKEVLQLLAEGRSNKEVATLLDLGLSTVETHRANLMQKLNLHNTAEIVLYARAEGHHRLVAGASPAPPRPDIATPAVVIY